MTRRAPAGERDAGATALAVAEHLAAGLEACVRRRQAALLALEQAVQVAQARRLPPSLYHILLQLAMGSFPPMPSLSHFLRDGGGRDHLSVPERKRRERR